MTIEEAGALEWDGTNLFITQTTGPTRKTIAYTTDIPTAAYATYVLATDKTFAGSGAAEVVTFTTEEVESGLTHDTGTDPEEITFPTAGNYELVLTVHATSTGADAVKVAIEKWDGDSWEDISNSTSLIPLVSGETRNGTLNHILTFAASEKIRIVASATSTNVFLNAIAAADGVAGVPAARLTIKKIN